MRMFPPNNFDKKKSDRANIEPNMTRTEQAKKDCAIMIPDDMECGMPVSDAYNKGVEAGVKWTDSHPNWHKYPEDKPRYSDTYIVAFDNEMVSAMMYYTNLDMFDGNYISKIVAWMKLPKPPKFD